MCDQPNRIVIVTGLSDPYITEIHVERPEDVVIVIYSIHLLSGTVFEAKDFTPLAVVDWVPCPDCEALIPPDGACWYCETKPTEKMDDADNLVVGCQYCGEWVTANHVCPVKTNES